MGAIHTAARNQTDADYDVRPRSRRIRTTIWGPSGVLVCALSVFRSRQGHLFRHLTAEAATVGCRAYQAHCQLFFDVYLCYQASQTPPLAIANALQV